MLDIARVSRYSFTVATPVCVCVCVCVCVRARVCVTLSHSNTHPAQQQYALGTTCRGGRQPRNVGLTHRHLQFGALAVHSEPQRLRYPLLVEKFKTDSVRVRALLLTASGMAATSQQRCLIWGTTWLWAENQGGLKPIDELVHHFHGLEARCRVLEAREEPGHDILRHVLRCARVF